MALIPRTRRRRRRCAPRTVVRSARVTLGVGRRAAGESDDEAAHLLARRAGRAAAGAGLRAEARPGSLPRCAARLGTTVTTSVCRVVERLPVALAELQLDRAAAQAKAEALVVVDGSRHRCASREKLRATASEAAAAGAIAAYGLASTTASSPRTPDAAERPVAGAAQVAGDELGGRAQVLHQARLVLQLSRGDVLSGRGRCRAAAATSRPMAVPTSSSTIERPRASTAAHQRLQQRRLTSAPFDGRRVGPRGIAERCVGEREAQVAAGRVARLRAGGAGEQRVAVGAAGGDLQRVVAAGRSRAQAGFGEVAVVALLAR